MMYPELEGESEDMYLEEDGSDGEVQCLCCARRGNRFSGRSRDLVNRE